MVKIVITEQDSDKRFYAKTLKQTKQIPDIVLDDTITYQEMIGFGGAFTESSAYNLIRINKEQREQAIKAYFDPVE